MKKRFDEIKVGEYFKYYGTVYRKHHLYNGMADQLTGKFNSNKYFWSDNKVIPVTVTIKVKEK